MPTFGVALAFVEELTAERKSVTLHLGRPRNPKAKNTSEPKYEDDEDNIERFGNATLKEVVMDSKGYFP